jgi:Secretion system C-terminal sorting domain
MRAKNHIQQVNKPSKHNSNITILHILPMFILNMLIMSDMLSQTPINAYGEIISITGNSISIGAINEVHGSFQAGADVMLIQIKDNVIGSNTGNNASFGNISSIMNAGVIETRTIVSRTGNTITLDQAPTSSFNLGPNSKVQLVSHPYLGNNFITTSAIGGLPWNGSFGGIISFQAGNSLTIAHPITADGIGFRPGAQNNDGNSLTCTPNNYAIIGSDLNYGLKGEGIYGISNANYQAGRAKIANGGGGGNSHNGGGGGGGNFVSGGEGGPGFPNCSPSVGGQGGLALSGFISGNRVFLGGGGGAGEGNDNTNTAGGSGGGIILIRADTIRTASNCVNALISANGLNGIAHLNNDGAGGGGAGGSIVLDVEAWLPSPLCPIVVSANGGNGGNVNHNQIHGGGGAGAQGTIIFSIPIPSNNSLISTLNGNPGCNLTNCSSLAGSASGSNNIGILGGLSPSLPSTFLYFVGTQSGNDLRLDWECSKDFDCEWFEVSHSMKSENWKIIEKIPFGQSSKYQLSIAPPLPGWHYYRVGAFDIDGRLIDEIISYVHYESANSSVVEIFPNPAKDQFVVKVIAPASEDRLPFSICSLSGTIMKTGELATDTETKVDVASLASGIYFLKIPRLGQTLKLNVCKE